MKTLLLSTIVLPLMACAGSMDPFDLNDFVSADVQFAPAPHGHSNTLDAILDKEMLTLQDIIKIADTMNPELAAERQNIDVATAALWEARLYPNPTAIVTIEDYRTREGATIGAMKRTVGFALPLAVGGRIGAASAVADKDREIASINYIWRRREILSNVKTAFILALASQRESGLARENRDLATQLRKVAQERFEAKTVPEMEILKTEIQLAKAESDLRNAENKSMNAIKALRAAIGYADLPDKRYDGAISKRFTPPNIADLRSGTGAAHPLVIAAELTKTSAELQCSLARAERLADPSVEIALGIDAEDETIIEGGLSIPIPLFNGNQAKIAAAEARIRQAELKIDAARQGVLSLFDEACGKFSAAQDRAATYAETILPKAQKAFEMTKEGYTAGKFGYLDVLDAQRTLMEAKSAYEAALIEMNLASIEIEKLTGRSLESFR